MSRLKIFLSSIFIFLIAYSLQLTASYADADISAVERPFLEGQYDKAERAAQSLIDQRSRERYELYYLKGLSELKLNKFKEARESFGAIISKYSSSNRVFDAHLGIGDSYMLEGNTQEAARTYNDIATRFPRDKNIAVVKDRLASELKPNAIPKNESTQRPSSGSMPSPVEASKGYISVQAGCFKKRRNAESLSKKLNARGYESYVELPIGSGDNLYRVKVGRLNSEPEAESIAAKLRLDGYKTKICDAIE